MKKLVKEELYGLEEYSNKRDEYRQKVRAHKLNRIVRIGENVSLHFEDYLTMRYQVQEMLRAEKIFDSAGIIEEIETYNPLIPDGQNWKATMMIQFDNAGDRKVALEKMIGIERATWVQVAGFDKVHPIANEDLERETNEKTSSVHFLRFELTQPMVEAVQNGAIINAGVDHPAYKHEVTVPDNIRNSLASDLD
ncbi:MULTISPECIES: DUF3501 family protein [Cycloclasticus]|jgi:hypothetical protein|uniref:DUF3501 family protein n=1 Tax=Cycloclasticus zancles 78-ME TaxID=1198232 RepID=S5T744_9GAMM|nr:MULTISPECIES: DUF3501 family protein [Cycloclasticus]AGS39364.1 hypothetical protein CYCME_1032 [Cycloclasticus zancles 78-ME]MDF1828572.1 DUF3501 family protein [Cycloclasticus pugetii]|tara:strand:- start:1040 stop:1621 length:582 start_codon:yes stop_codon:yes gene_type:complete